MKHLLLALTLLAVPFTATADVSEVIETDAVTEFNAEKITAAKQAEQSLWNHLDASRADAERAKIRLSLGELDKALLENAGDGQTQGHLVGIHTPVGQPIELAREAANDHTPGVEHLERDVFGVVREPVMDQSSLRLWIR